MCLYGMKDTAIFLFFFSFWGSNNYRKSWKKHEPTSQDSVWKKMLSLWKWLNVLLLLLHSKSKCLLNSWDKSTNLGLTLCLYPNSYSDFQWQLSQLFMALSSPSIKWRQDIIVVTRVTRIKNEQYFVPCWISLSTVVKRNKNLQVILGPFTHEIHNTMVNKALIAFSLM